ncbi:unannotated protein [freshwater metagenome]|uniref:Unannotated protein n=1 Tax=freshwater metagenome TaxID=449393 RepID=A0A6J6TFF7_9ZZZZ
MRPPMIPSGTAVIATSETIEREYGEAALKRRSPNQIASAIPEMMHKAYI